jgi:hypothetical protein
MGIDDVPVSVKGIEIVAIEVEVANVVVELSGKLQASFSCPVVEEMEQ